ncbi:FAD-binding protein [Terrilactibacillus sp. BCM23-1]|uniref:FAD-binding protein n=1 Tax=Terrilactibacillus tamarindi TaxID=2599694 RepID=A0A6N8CP76_9BACI|nr:NAD(P)/FAD-dependent oxidoreductase [Terrilactibacillus tamarindi]MTT31390.1 FAD-binding protein [Terrilactibacillus tamarindi]
MIYDCIIIGGGIAGMQAAIQLGRYKHRVMVIDSNDGRSTLCKSYHNVLGYPDGVSGQELRNIGTEQAKNLGVEFLNDKAVKAEKNKDHFEIQTESNSMILGQTVLIATGVMDRIPHIPNLFSCLGISVYICPDCDGYEVKDKPTLVIGSGNVGANMALILTYWTKDLIYINHEQKKVSETIMDKLHSQRIQYIESPVQEVEADESKLKAVILTNGQKIAGEHAFVAFGGNEVKSDLAKQLGVEILENKHILVNPRTKMTNIPGVWAAGDVVAHSEQVTIAMGDGSQAAIWIHKWLMGERNG